ncbi:MAG: SUMF1/EgtB/PvdO family nonheme iron enzyme [Bacteroidia bacterium]|nr:SUMF1/EgtB/PvdO family nonheme iron enzyme [Bacteroidia bacterium]
MKFTIEIFIISIFSFYIHAQNFNKLINEKYSKLNDTLYVSKFETSNFEYQLFLKENKNNKDLLIDSLKWLKLKSFYYSEPFCNMYHWHMAYQNYPIVNISYESAVKYCQWLTSKYMNGESNSKKIRFKLPTEKEWLEACQLEKNRNWPTYLVNNDSLYFKPNVKLCESNNCITKTSPDNVISKYKTMNGCSHIIGNVSEMLITKGKSKGGSWLHSINDSAPDKSQDYSEPNPFTGFRVFLVVYSK